MDVNNINTKTLFYLAAVASHLASQRKTRNSKQYVTSTDSFF